MSASKDAGDRLELLLADADEHRPVLEEGLPSEAAQKAPKPKKAPKGTEARSSETEDRRMEDADPNDLKLQRWGVIAPKGPEGDRLLEAIAPLIELRKAEQDAPVMIYRVAPEMDGREAVDWRDQEYWSNRVSEHERPLYLLMLGDLHETSMDLQHTMANSALVGRLHFTDVAGETDLEGYAAYAQKAVRYAREGTSFNEPDMAFFVAQDMTTATRIGESQLVNPSVADSERARAAGVFPAASVQKIGAETVDELLAAGAGERPSVLLSVSHGMGAPRNGWKNEEQMRRRQGALILDRGEVLEAERLLNERFLPGGMWFCLACFGAGTPSTSAFHAWLLQLAQEGAWSGQPESVLKSLPSNGQQPFVAALPQAALRNPDGPLGVIGHMDLAWTYGFASAKDLSKSRSDRVFAALQVLVRGSRAGVGLNTLLRFYRETNDSLTVLYEMAERARLDKRPDPTNLVDRGHLWMLRNDLRGYVLLGDPAARLPLKKNTLAPKTKSQAAVIIPEVQGNSSKLKAEGEPRNPAQVTSEAGASIPADVDVKVKAVDAMIRGDETPRTIADRAGVSLDVLWDWVDASRAAMRERLSK